MKCQMQRLRTAFLCQHTHGLQVSAAPARRTRGLSPPLNLRTGRGGGGGDRRTCASEPCIFLCFNVIGGGGGGVYD
jgi:hypothetical protein